MERGIFEGFSIINEKHWDCLLGCYSVHSNRDDSAINNVHVV